jgi:PEP-CTERM motif-containing protein
MYVKTLALLAASLLTSAALAAPVVYTFTTGPVSQNNPFNPNGSLTTLEQIGISNSIASILAGTSVSGSFAYDSQTPRTGDTIGGATGTRGTVYSAFDLTPGVRHSSFTALSGSVNGGAPRSFSDPRGFTIVANDDYQLSCFPTPCTPPPMVDFFGFNAESGTGVATRNIAGFSVLGGDYRLFNVRMFWIESFATPNPIPDLFNNADEPAPDPLLSAPPSLNARLAIDFVHMSDTDGVGTQYIVFYDNLLVTAAIPEPQTYALLLAGLALLGFTASRRRARR